MKQYRHKATASGVVLTLASVALSSNAFGQALEEVVVTSQKRAESLQDVPIAVTALSAQALENSSIRVSNDLAALTPGLVYNNTSVQTRIFLRGVGTTASSNGLDPSIANYIDNRYLARQVGALSSLVDLDHVEVLKGPQGILFGRNSTGGAIRMITKDVSDQFEGHVKATGGNYGTWGLEGVANVPLSEEFGARFVAMTSNRDGYSKNQWSTGSRDWDNKDYQYFRGKFKWKVSDRATARLTTAYWRSDDTDGVDGIVVAPQTNQAIGLGGLSGTTNNQNVYTAQTTGNKGHELSEDLQIDMKFDAFDFVSTTTYGDFYLGYTLDADGTQLQLIDLFGIEKIKDWSQEFRLTSNRKDKLEWLLGAFYYTSNDTVDSIITAGNGAVRLSSGVQTVKVDAWAPFGNAKYHFTDQWALAVGVRYSHEQKDLLLVHSTAPVAAPGTVYPSVGHADWSNTSPQSTLEYKSMAGLFYATYAKGFKSGGFNYPISLLKPVINPEEITSYELGYKGEFASALRFNAAVYHYHLKNLQLNRSIVSATSSAVVTENAADASINGAEADITWAATDHLVLSTAMAYIDGKYDSYPDATINVFNGTPNSGFSLQTHDASGMGLIRTPRWSMVGQAEYTIALGEATMPIAVSYSWKDKYKWDFAIDSVTEQVVTQKAYGLLALRIGYVPAGGKWEAALWGNNLTDAGYLENVSLAALGGIGTRAAPRTYGVDFKYNF